MVLLKKNKNAAVVKFVLITNYHSGRVIHVEVSLNYPDNTEPMPMKGTLHIMVKTPNNS